MYEKSSKELTAGAMDCQYDVLIAVSRCSCVTGEVLDAGNVIGEGACEVIVAERCVSMREWSMGKSGDFVVDSLSIRWYHLIKMTQGCAVVTMPYVNVSDGAVVLSFQHPSYGFVGDAAVGVNLVAVVVVVRHEASGGD
eukprot:1300113-Amphidinium_carterae.3